MKLSGSAAAWLRGVRTIANIFRSNLSVSTEVEDVSPESPATSLLVIYVPKLCIDAYANVFTESLFITTKKWGKPTCVSMGS